MTLLDFLNSLSFFIIIGIATIYSFINNSWIIQTVLSSNSIDISDKYGYSVSLKNNIAVIGAPGANNNKGIYNSFNLILYYTLFYSILLYYYEFILFLGCIYVYKDILETQDSWTLISVLAPKNGENGDMFGFSIINFQSVLIIGAPYRVFNNGIMNSRNNTFFFNLIIFC